MIHEAKTVQISFVVHHLLNLTLEDDDVWQARQKEKYDKMICEGETEGLSKAEIRAKYFATDFAQFEKDKEEAVQYSKDKNQHQQIVNKVSKKFSDLVRLIMISRTLELSSLGGFL